MGLDIEAFVRQIESDSGEVSRSWELEQSHPSLPFRLWALVRFSHSDAYAALAEQSCAGLELSAIDEEISRRFAQMGEGRLSEMESRVYSLALVWAGAAMVLDDDVIDRRERKALVQLVGKEHADKVVAFAEAQGQDAVLSKLADAVSRINAASFATRRRFHEAIYAFSIALDVSPEETRAGRYLERTLRLR